jgi:MFS family permease
MTTQQAPHTPLLWRIIIWLFVVLMALVTALPIAFLAQWWRHLVRYDVSIVSTVLPLVGMAAGVAALHFVQRGKERYGLGGTISSVASLIGVALIVVGALIGRVSQNWLLGTNLMGVGLWAATIGLVALAIITIYAGVVPWWGGAALLVGNPLGKVVIPSLLFSFIPESHNAHDPVSKLARVFDLTSSAEQWLSVAWGVTWGVVPWVVVGFAVLLAARRRTERPARVR